MQITDILAQIGGIKSMAQELGVSETDAASGAEALVPAILGGFKKQAQAQPEGVAGFGGLLAEPDGNHGRKERALKISVTAAPEGGKANEAVIALLAKEWGVAKSAISVVTGATDRRKVVDKVMIFTDCQLWNSRGPWGNSIAQLWKQYKQLAPQAKIYLFDLAGYGNTSLQVQRDDVFMIAGWSDKIFQVLDAVESGSDALAMINRIEI